MTGHYPCAGDTSVCLTVGEDHQAFVRASGELDIATADRLDDALQAAALCSTSIHLDLEHVRFMDARTVAVLVQRDNLCRREGGRLQLHNISGEPRRVLEICGLGRMIGQDQT
jgi:anti-sigma B factor antagonist